MTIECPLGSVHRSSMVLKLRSPCLATLQEAIRDLIASWVRCQRRTWDIARYHLAVGLTAVECLAQRSGRHLWLVAECLQSRLYLVTELEVTFAGLQVS